MSDTPRTDAEEVVCCEDEMCVPSSFAGELERELAAAINARNEARRMISEINDENERLCADLAAAIKQRDEARELYCLERSDNLVGRVPRIDAKTIAKNRGWEGLFKEEGGA